MPLISNFYGISILMFFQEHNPPHFHAKYGGEIGIFSIKSGIMIAGNLPFYAKKLVKEWFKLHKQELLDNWQRAEKGQKLQAINPLI